MKPQSFVQAHLTLLLAQHGERAVIEALGALIGTSISELEVRLADVQKLGHAHPTKSRGAGRAGGSIEALLAQHPDKADLLRQLQTRFVNRTILPELKDVRRFLDRHGEPTSSLRKREDALPKVARHWVQLPVSDLQAILATPTDSSFSSLGVISDQILGRK